MNLHAPHPEEPNRTLCGRYESRDDRVAEEGDHIDCLSCLMHLENKTTYEDTR